MKKFLYAIGAIFALAIIGQIVFAAPYPTGVGGTGTSIAPASGTVPIGNGAGSYTPAFLTQGSNIVITNGSGSVTIAATGIATNTLSLFNGNGFTTTTVQAVLNALSASGCLSYSSSTGLFTFTCGIPATTTINGQQAIVFRIIGDGTTVTSTVSGATTTFSIITTGNWSGTWQGANSSSFYLASNPSGFIKSAPATTTINGALGSLFNFVASSTGSVLSITTSTNGGSSTINFLLQLSSYLQAAIISINGNTTAAQTFTGGAGISVASAGGNTTTTNTGVTSFTGQGCVTASNSTGTVSLTVTCISGNQSITFTMSGDATGTASGATAITDSITVTGLNGKALPANATGTLQFSGNAWKINLATSSLGQYDANGNLSSYLGSSCGGGQFVTGFSASGTVACGTPSGSATTTLIAGGTATGPAITLATSTATNPTVNCTSSTCTITFPIDTTTSPATPSGALQINSSGGFGAWPNGTVNTSTQQLSITAPAGTGAGNSITTGGLENINTGNSTSTALVLYCPQAMTTGRCFVVNEPAQSSTVDTVVIISHGTSTTGLDVQSWTGNKGAFKCDHAQPEDGSSDANASCFSAALNGTSTAAQGWFLDSASGTTGFDFQFRDKGVTLFSLQPESNGLISHVTSTFTSSTIFSGTVSSTEANAIIVAGASGTWGSYAGSSCSGGQAVNGVSASGTVTGCFTPAGGSGGVGTTTAYSAGYLTQVSSSLAITNSPLYSPSAKDVTSGSTTDYGLFSTVNASSVVTFQVASSVNNPYAVAIVGTSSFQGNIVVSSTIPTATAATGGVTVTTRSVNNAGSVTNASSTASITITYSGGGFTNGSFCTASIASTTRNGNLAFAVFASSSATLLQLIGEGSTTAANFGTSTLINWNCWGN